MKTQTRSSGQNMAFEVRNTPQFEADYDSALDYLINALGSRDGALHLMDEMDRVEKLLKDNPFINAISRKSELCTCQCREQLIMNYVILYTVVDDVVMYLRFFHQMQDYEHLIG